MRQVRSGGKVMSCQDHARPLAVRTERHRAGSCTFYSVIARHYYVRALPFRNSTTRDHYPL